MIHRDGTKGDIFCLKHIYKSQRQRSEHATADSRQSRLRISHQFSQKINTSQQFLWFLEHFKALVQFAMQAAVHVIRGQTFPTLMFLCHLKRISFVFISHWLKKTRLLDILIKQMKINCKENIELNICFRTVNLYSLTIPDKTHFLYVRSLWCHSTSWM